MKKHTIHFTYLLLGFFGLFGQACKKTEPINYQGKNVLYFRNAYVGNEWFEDAFQDTISINFFQYSFQTDTLNFSNRKYFADFVPKQVGGAAALEVWTGGQLSSENRPYLMTKTGEGIKYLELPPADSLFIPADSLRVFPDLRLVRPAMSDTVWHEVSVMLTDNANFNPSVHGWSKFVVKFGNITQPPPQWPENFLGPYDFKKLTVIVDAMNAAEPEARSGLLQEYLMYEKKRTVTFMPFTLDNAYAVITKVAGTGSGTNLRDFFRMFTAICRNYLQQQEAAGHPIRDAEGHPINFPEF